jgi:hypothetical protein
MELPNSRLGEAHHHNLAIPFCRALLLQLAMLILSPNLLPSSKLPLNRVKAISISKSHHHRLIHYNRVAAIHLQGLLITLRYHKEAIWVGITKMGGPPQTSGITTNQHKTLEISKILSPGRLSHRLKETTHRATTSWEVEVFQVTPL